MRSLLKSKRGQLPFISDIINIFLSIVPKPILLMLFILLITIISSFIIPLFLNTFIGYACVKENNVVELYQVPFNNLIRKTISLDVGGFINSLLKPSDILFEDELYRNGDKRFFKVPEDCFVTVANGSDTFTGYTGQCTNCSGISQNPYAAILGINDTTSIKFRNSICMSDGYKLTGLLISDLWRTCQKCSPPDLYFFDIENCFSETACYFRLINDSNLDIIPDNSNDFANSLNLQKIKVLGGVKRTQNMSEIVNLGCADVNTPTLFFFNIELFNRTMWVLLIVGEMLVTFALAWYNVVL